MRLYDNPSTWQMIDDLLDGVLFDGRFEFNERAANLIELLTVIELVLEADGNIDDLLFQAKSWTYEHTSDRHEGLVAFTGRVKQQTQLRLIKAKGDK